MKNKILKSTFIVILVFSMCLSIIGCGKSNANTSLSNDNITIKKYIGLEIAKVDKQEITDDTVSEAINEKLEKGLQPREVTGRAVEADDTVTCDYSGSIDGEVFEGGSQQDAEIHVTNSDTGYISGFTSSMIGHNVGDEFDSKMKFPDDYGNEKLKGKEVTFHYVIKKISVVDKPELNDDYVKNNIDGYDTVDAWKAGIRKELEDNADEEYKYKKNNYAWQALLENVEVKKVPDDKIQEDYENMKSQLEEEAKKSNLSLNDYLSQTYNQTEEDVEEKYKESIKDKYKIKDIVELISDKEKIKLSDSEYDEQINEILKQVGCNSKEELLEMYKGRITEDDLKMEALLNKVVDFISKNAIEIEGKEPPKGLSN